MLSTIMGLADLPLKIGGSGWLLSTASGGSCVGVCTLEVVGLLATILQVLSGRRSAPVDLETVSSIVFQPGQGIRPELYAFRPYELRPCCFPLLCSLHCFPQFRFQLAEQLKLQAVCLGHAGSTVWFSLSQSMMPPLLVGTSTWS